MKFFVDTADVDAIRELHDLGMVDGVTTNPSLILKSGRDILEVTKEICSFVEGPVSAEVVALKADEMIAEGRKLAAIAPNIAVKVPLTWDGLKACKVLSAKASWSTSPCASAPTRRSGRQGRGDLHQPLHRPAGRHQPRRAGPDRRHPPIYDNYDFETQILAASIRTPTTSRLRPDRRRRDDRAAFGDQGAWPAMC
jgi:transaldolase